MNDHQYIDLFVDFCGSKVYALHGIELANDIHDHPLLRCLPRDGIEATVDI